MRSLALQLSVCVFSLALCNLEGAAARPWGGQRAAAVERLLRTVADELADPADHAAMRQLIAVFTARGALASDQGEWMLLRFDRDGELEAVQVNAAALLEAPPLIQRAAILHELEHLKGAPETARSLHNASALPPASVGRLQHLIRVLVDDEHRAYCRDIRHVHAVVRAHGGLGRYLATRPPHEREPIRQHYRRRVRPFVALDGTIEDRRLRRDFIFLGTFPHRHPRHYTAALMWEALQGHVEVRRGPDGLWRPVRLLAPDAFLVWLAPS